MSSDLSSDHWDFYSCEIDDKPHSTLVNLSLFNVAPIDTLAVFRCIEVKLRHPNPDHGMTTNEEFQPLSDMEDLIGKSETKELKYIARQTGDCKRKFYFYSTSGFDFGSLFEKIGQAFPAYEKTTFNFEDSEWQTYFDDLYPNVIGMNEIINRSVFDQLSEAGDDLNVPRTIDHSVIFHKKKQAKDFEKIVKAKGFEVAVESRGILKKTFDLLVQRIDPPSRLDPITLELKQLAEHLGGSYDGWGCMVATSK